MTKQAFFVGSLAIIVPVLVVASVLAGGLGTSAQIPPVVTNGPEDVDETFYVVAYHWDWAVFTEDGTQIDQIRVEKGTTLEIYAVNLHAMQAVMELPAPVAEVIMAFEPGGEHDMDEMEGMAEPMEGVEDMDGAEEPLWPYMDDHGFLIDWFGVVAYLSEEAEEPARVVFTADRPGEYEFVCTNFCGLPTVADHDDDMEGMDEPMAGMEDEPMAGMEDEHTEDIDGDGHIYMPRIMLIVT
jgi:hypothetical protein